MSSSEEQKWRHKLYTNSRSTATRPLCYTWFSSLSSRTSNLCAEELLFAQGQAALTSHMTPQAVTGCRAVKTRSGATSCHRFQAVTCTSHRFQACTQSSRTTFACSRNAQWCWHSGVVSDSKTYVLPCKPRQASVPQRIVGDATPSRAESELTCMYFFQSR